MATGDAPTQPPPNTDKIIPFSIPNKVPIKLDLEKHNYNSWSSFSLIHLGSLGLKSHVEDDAASTNPDWCQLDDLIKMWIISSLCDSLQDQVVTTPDTMAINEYCTKIRSMAGRLKNLGCDPNYLLRRPNPLLIPATPPGTPADQQAQFLQPQFAHQPGILRPPQSQATTLPSASSTMTLQDPTWNMDTGSSSH
nr:hybrid signal transduction histidine kinase M [Tanacetum cinerariifolium]